MFALSVHTQAYPQKLDDFEPSWLNRTVESWRTWLRTHWQNRPGQLQALVSEADGPAREAWLALPDAHERQQALRGLQLDLRRQGFEDRTVLPRLLAWVSLMAEQQLGMRPHPTQLMGAAVLLSAQVVEMDTGEGKSLTAALAAACAALAGLKVHVVTVNDYLASRDAASFAPFYQALGLEVATVLESQSPEEKRLPYRASVVYCANKVVVFDYLKDRLAFRDGMRPLGLAVKHLAGDGQVSTLLPGLQFAIVDEADSVFIDEARTPLVISADTNDDERLTHYRQAIALARLLERERDFLVLEGGRRLLLTETGAALLAERAALMGGLWRGPRLREEAVTQALSALWVFRRDIDYIVSEDKVMIVDENTGRVMPDRSWERGLQQLIEIKEDLTPTPIRDNLARLSYQLFFRRYLNLSGMTGTCREVAGELGEVYGLGVVRVEPFRPSRRQRLPTRILPTSEERWAAIVTCVFQCQARGQPVLIGTRSIQSSEQLSVFLTAAGIHHQVLNAKQNSDEAEIVAYAGACGQVTIATNMAGRGTDIKLGAGVVERGGLFVILSEGHDNTRVDRQLAGRCARQGDPGCWQAIVSLDDEVLRILPPRLRSGLVSLLRKWPESSVMQLICRAVYRLTQMAVSRRHRKERRQLMWMDYRSRQSLSFSGVAE